MAGKGFVLTGTKMTSDSVVYNATQGTRADGVFYAAIGSTAAEKYRRNEIINALKLCRDRLKVAMGYAANQLTVTQTELVCKVDLTDIKRYSIVKQAATVAPEAALIIFGFTFLARRTGAGTGPDPYVYPQGAPARLGSLGVDAALDEILHAYMRLNSKD